MRMKDVNSMMRYVWVWAMLVVVAAGCQVGNTDELADGEIDVPPVMTEDGPTPEEVAAGLEEATEIIDEELKKVVSSEPGTKGWEPSTDSLGELGKLLDTTFIELENARCEGKITYFAPVGKMSTQLAVDIKNSRMFKIAFAVPSLL